MFPFRLFFTCCLCVLALSAHASKQSQNFQVLSDADWQLISHSPGIMLGGNQPTAIQIIFDPDCPASARLYDYLQIKHAHTAIRWVPVAHFRLSSMGKAAALLAAKDPAQALHANFKGYDYSRQTGGVESISAPADIRAALQRLHLRLLEWIGATPVIVVRTPEGQVLLNQLGNRARHIDRVIDLSDGLKGYAP